MSPWIFSDSLQKVHHPPLEKGWKNATNSENTEGFQPPPSGQKNWHRFTPTVGGRSVTVTCPWLSGDVPVPYEDFLSIVESRGRRLWDLINLIFLRKRTVAKFEFENHTPLVEAFYQVVKKALRPAVSAPEVLRKLLMWPFGHGEFTRPEINGD